MTLIRHDSLIVRLNLVLLALLIILFGGLFWGLSSGLEQRLTHTARASLHTTNQSVVDLLAAYRANLDRSASSLNAVWASNFSPDWDLHEGKLLNDGKIILDGNEQADRFTQITGSVATIFIREGQDFRRLATSLTKADGTRSTGTLLGDAHPARLGLLSGKPYVGVANLFGHDYMTVYRPIKNKQGEIVGSLFIGFDFSLGMADLKKKIAAIKLGESGYLLIIDAGKNLGKALVHPTMANKDLLKDPDAQSYIQTMLKQGEGQIVYSDKGEAREASFARLNDPNWLIVSTQSQKEVLADARWTHDLILIACIAGALLLSVSLHLALSRWLKQPLLIAIRHIERLANGDFSGHIPHARNDEIGDLLNAFEKMQEQLLKLFMDTKESADHLLRGAEQISSSSEQVSGGAKEQSEAAASMASAVQELTVSINLVANNARDAQLTSTESGRVSHEGGEVIQQTVAGIQAIASTVRIASDSVAELNEYSQQIAGIANVIKEIADQTNLLALNAAIEAARAGDTGRGFAVVADEVRKLAERTTASTFEIGKMIEKIQTGTSNAVQNMSQGVIEVEKGMVLANQAGDAIRKIREGSLKVMNVVMEISQALKTQTSMANSVAGNVDRIAQMSVENSRAVEESAHTAHSLRDLASRMDLAVAHFKLS
ncbi:methyl-accepting chemotaxis protein [Iodobacter sp. LRB]|uniref:methyl-accepting chemotaxis protein n=1 Tax=unclassified Iodobacter TaxID=235634 RepID=UPI000C1012BD|nr:methyl-accepting chemotaxis protein [Iodobacter sp. BJB302]PHV03167.1 hypothetical protein CSQ88_03440 [Iodobacter sp. BJB302]